MFIKLYSQEYFLHKFHKRNLQNITDNGIEVYKDSLTGEDYILIKNKKVYIPNIPETGSFYLNSIITLSMNSKMNIEIFN